MQRETGTVGALLYLSHTVAAAPLREGEPHCGDGRSKRIFDDLLCSEKARAVQCAQIQPQLVCGVTRPFHTHASARYWDFLLCQLGLTDFVCTCYLGDGLHRRVAQCAMTNMKPAGAAAGKVVKTTGTSKDVDELGETYMVNEESAKDMNNDLDDFEARLNGQKPAERKPAASKPSASNKPVPKSNVPPMFMPPKHKHVKPTSMSEEQEDALEARKAVSELDKFEQRLGGK